MAHHNHQKLIDLAQRADEICARGSYDIDSTTRIDLKSMLATSFDGTRLITPESWGEIERVAIELPLVNQSLAPIHVTQESTLAALQRITVTNTYSAVAALNFASARNPGGGYRNGAQAQEETLARASGLVPTLERCWTYYDQNRKQDSLLYTNHAIWSPNVPFFADDDGNLLITPYVAGIITMPAPNAGAMHSEADLLGVIPTFRQRIRWVFALAAQCKIEHLILGAWGCGAFGNQSDLVARLFREELKNQQPWRRIFSSVTFAIIDTSRRRTSFKAFASALSDLNSVENI